MCACARVCACACRTQCACARVCICMQDTMSRDRLIGICIAMSGIAWYTKLLTSPQQQPAPVVKSINGSVGGNGSNGKP